MRSQRIALLAVSLLSLPLLAADIAVTNTNDSGDGSLRAAIEAANAAPSANNSPVRIVFRIPAPVPQQGWFTIAPLTPLPAFTGANVILDGSSQTAFTGDTNTTGPEVEVTGVHSVASDGLVVSGEGTEIGGLAINAFARNGILVKSSATILRPHVFVHDDEIAANGERGIRMLNGSGSFANNVIIGNARSGVYVDNGAVNVTGNRIVANGASGIFFDAPTTDPLANRVLQNNVIAWNGQFGISSIGPRGLVVRENSMHDNGAMAVDIGLDGPSPSPATGNYAGLVERPTILSTRYDAASGDTIIALLLDAQPITTSTTTWTVYLYATPHLDRAGFAEGETFLTKVVFPHASEIRVHADLRGQWITGLTERLIDFHDLQLTGSSELSAGVKVPE